MKCFVPNNSLQSRINTDSQNVFPHTRTEAQHTHTSQYQSLSSFVSNIFDMPFTHTEILPLPILSYATISTSSTNYGQFINTEVSNSMHAIIYTISLESSTSVAIMLIFYTCISIMINNTLSSRVSHKKSITHITIYNTAIPSCILISPRKRRKLITFPYTDIKIILYTIKTTLY